MRRRRNADPSEIGTSDRPVTPSDMRLSRWRERSDPRVRTGAVSRVDGVELPLVTRPPPGAGPLILTGIMRCAAWVVMWRRLLRTDRVTGRVLWGAVHQYASWGGHGAQVEAPRPVQCGYNWCMNVATPTSEVGIRELKNGLSAYIDRVRNGEEVIVTDRGRPVARLSSLDADQDHLAELIAAGIVRAPTSSKHRHVPKHRIKSKGTVSDLVAEQRR